jgi:hypothetical protein
MKGWSDDHPGHQPLMVMIELKDAYSPSLVATGLLADLEADVLSVWPRERIVAPADVRGGDASLEAALAARGWPKLGACRGKILFVMLGEQGFIDGYVARGEGLLFVNDGVDKPHSAIVLIDDPIADGAAIGTAVRAGLLVRTRADADTVEARANDRTRLDAALASGAQFISTDFPVPVVGYQYVVDMPGGVPSRCNPITAPSGCTPAAIEDPSQL